MQHKVRVYAAVHKSGWESPSSGKTRRIGLIANWRIRVELSYSVRRAVQKVGMQGGGMTRSGLIKRLAAANPYLHARDIERIGMHPVRTTV
jgi:hypothetical protein